MWVVRNSLDGWSLSVLSFKDQITVSGKIIDKTPQVPAWGYLTTYVIQKPTSYNQPIDSETKHTLVQTHILLFYIFLKLPSQLFVMDFTLNWFLLVSQLRCPGLVCVYLCLCFGLVCVYVCAHFFCELGGRRGYKPGLSSEDDFYPCRGSLNAKRWMQGDPILTHTHSLAYTHTHTDGPMQSSCTHKHTIA